MTAHSGRKSFVEVPVPRHLKAGAPLLDQSKRALDVPARDNGDHAAITLCIIALQSIFLRDPSAQRRDSCYQRYVASKSGLSASGRNNDNSTSSLSGPSMLASLRTVRRQPSSQWLILGIVSIGFAVYLLYNWARTPNTMLEPGSHLHYQTVEGFFLQSDTATDPHKLDPTKENFGLIDRTYFTDAEFDPDHEKTQWERFEHFVKHMNDASSDDEAYKVLFLGRHGEGYHNLAEEFYGTNEWDCYWSKENGNATIQWVDSDLSPHGVLQVEDLSKFWETALKELKVPAPESYYTSPLSRCLQTAELTFSELDLPSEAPFKPIVKELLRERIGIHTCDKRSTRSWIEENYPNYDVEYDLTEEDELWDPDVRESNSAQDARLKILLDSIFVTDTSSFISITSHGGATHAILTAVKHRPFELDTAGVLPVLVKAEKWNVEIHPPHIDPPTLAPECEKKNPAIVHELSDKEREFESEKFEE